MSGHQRTRPLPPTGNQPYPESTRSHDRNAVDPFFFPGNGCRRRIPGPRARTHDARRTARGGVAGQHLCAAHAGPVPDPAGLCRVRAGPARRARRAARRPGHGHLRPDAGVPAYPAGLAVRPHRAQAGDGGRPAAVYRRRPGGRVLRHAVRHHRRARAAGHGRDLRRHHRLHRRPDPRAPSHQGHGDGGRQHRADLRAVAGDCLAAAAQHRHVRHLRADVGAGPGRHRCDRVPGADPAAAAPGAAAVPQGAAQRRPGAAQCRRAGAARVAGGNVHGGTGDAGRCRHAAGPALEGLPAGGAGVVRADAGPDDGGRALRPRAPGAAGRGRADDRGAAAVCRGARAVGDRRGLAAVLRRLQRAGGDAAFAGVALRRGRARRGARRLQHYPGAGSVPGRRRRRLAAPARGPQCRVRRLRGGAVAVAYNRLEHEGAAGARAGSRTGDRGLSRRLVPHHFVKLWGRKEA
ncbi:hypothetical protein CBM2634_A50075 [Cupriavidus taiwanensis]|uniref:Uncharacterized protein n=1 Tax=Cupriavidus taiwanensis TaxID=164546 RepID=A0A375J141_9BURK|nr:hypothetical protein CBM2634_A50075 [Cupriavidus taiwanensis]